MEEQYKYFDHILRAMRDGDLSTLEKVDRDNHQFPFGVDEVAGRRWVINAIDVGTPQVVRWMLRQKVPLLFRDEEGFTVLHTAIERTLDGKYEIMNDLIRAGADVNAYGLNGWTPLHMAAARNDCHAVQILLDAGADTNLRTTMDNLNTPEEEADLMAAVDAGTLLRRWKKTRS